MKKNTNLSIIFYIIAFIGACCASTGTIGSVIYFIYEWAVSDALFKQALWSACKFWLIMTPMGIVLAFISYFLAKSLEE